MASEPRMFYFGPWDGAGHFLHSERGTTLYDRPAGFPWNENSGDTGIDCQLQPGCCKDKYGRWRHDREIEGEALLHHRGGWTALSFWDRSVDKRGGCNSTYFAEGTFTFDEMVAMARERFAKRWSRMDFEVKLANPEAPHAGLPTPDSPEAPKDLTYEAVGPLGPAIQRYLTSTPLSAQDVELIRAYCKQWIDSPAWDQNPNADMRSREVLCGLRLRVAGLQTYTDIDQWVSDATAEGMDPL